MKWKYFLFFILVWCLQINVIFMLPQRMANLLAANRKAQDMCKKYMTARFVNKTILNPIIGEAAIIRPQFDCYRVEALIIGGTKAEPKEFPHMALIGYGHKAESADWLCGGSLISEQFVLSAAHCNHEYRGKPSWAKLGDLDISRSNDDARPYDYKIIDIYDHPNYKPTESYNDITLYKLHTVVVFTPYIRPICLFTNDMRLPTDKKAAISGWGATGPNEQTSDILKKATVLLVENKKCESVYRTNTKGFSNGFKSDFAICAGDPRHGNDTCQGDSGGPLQILMPSETCMYLQVGVTSVGQFNCGDKTPAVYTRVSKYIEWIRGIVWPN